MMLILRCCKLYGKDNRTKYKELSEQEHVLLRPGMYVGSVKPELSTQFVLIIKNR